ncbi:MAG: BamA/TamA family outer membrane protein [Pseudomonadota bacterium]|nr:BamA/TamA family outer membrane protein [Pseudomonadota bacterium]
MTHSRTPCLRVPAGAGLTCTSLAFAFIALTAAALAPAARAQTAAPATPADPSTSAVSTPPSGVTQTAPAPAAPPESIAPAPTPEGAVGPTSAAPEVTAFDITVQAPPEVSDLLERHLELQRYRAVTDLDEVELARLMVLAERDARNLVGTLGYFSPDIRITREGGLNQRPTIVVAVEPGQVTRIGPVGVNFSGDISDSTDEDAIAQRTGIQRDWRLPEGERFTQDAWDGAKTQALRQLVARRYPAGKLAGSLADIDAPTHTAKLNVHLDSGPLYRLGALQVSGVQRYDPVLVPRLARLSQGAVYDQNQLVQAQQRLAASGYFDSAYVFINPEGDPQAVPVQVQVREAKLQKIILGVGLTTDSGPRASVEHTHLRVPGAGWRAATKLQLEKKAPFAQTEWMSIPNESSWRWVALARAERLNDNELITQAQRLRFGRIQSGERIDRNIYVQYDRASVRGSGLQGATAADTGDGSALTANYVWTGRYFDSLPFPSRGYGLGFELGAGTTLGQDRQPFSRTVGRWLGIRPLARGRIAMRAEAGAVLAKNSAPIPSTQLFRTGGDTTVRGYAYRDIGIELANGVIGPGRYMATGSVEWQRPLTIKGRPSEFENTFFIDAGAVADKPQDLSPSVGIGTGLRWRSPIGPLQIDLAYGVKVQKVRLHVSVGFIF